MREIFLTVLEMSITASVIIPIVMLIRFLLRRAPRKYSCLLWTVVAFRLICPFSFESMFSIFNVLKKKEISVQSVTHIAGSVQNSGAAANTVNTAVSSTPSVNMPSPFDWVKLFSLIWLCGIAVLTVYSIVSYIMIRRSVRTAVRDKDNIYFTESKNAPFILGFIKPKIYIPYNMDEGSRDYVIAHESYHIKRNDHVVKLLSYMILTLHWFNPLCWLSFMMLSKDIELSCDEKVLSNGAELKEYSKLLVSLAVRKSFPAPAPLAFGEVGVKHRVRNILKWKKPTLWISVTALVVCICVVCACIANAESDGEDVKKDNSSSETENSVINDISYGNDSGDFTVDSGSISYESEIDTDTYISSAEPEPEPEPAPEPEYIPETEIVYEAEPETVPTVVEKTEPQYEPEPSQGLDLAEISDIELDKNILPPGSGDVQLFPEYDKPSNTMPKAIVLFPNKEYPLPGIYY